MMNIYALSYYKMSTLSILLVQPACCFSAASYFVCAETSSESGSVLITMIAFLKRRIPVRKPRIAFRLAIQIGKIISFVSFWN